MKIETNENCDIVLQDVFNTIFLKTEEGNTLGICMRDDTFEMKLAGSDRWYRVDVDTGEINLLQCVKKEHVCSRCGGTGEIKHYPDTGGHFGGGGRAPGSGWRTVPCPNCARTGK